MTIETGINNAGVYIDALDDTYPASGDDLVEGDDHIRGIKNTLLNTFPSITGAVTATHTELNKLDGVTVTTGQINDAGNNANQASTEQGGTGASDGADTWAKLADFTFSTATHSIQMSYKLMDTLSGDNDTIAFTVILLAGSTDYSTIQSAIIIHENTNPAASILNTGIKMVADATAIGSVIGLWVKKETINKRFVLKELAKTDNITSLTYYTDAPWQAAEPTGAYEVTSAAPASLALSGDAPATPAANTLYADSMVKAWGYIDNSAGVASINDDVNISGVSNGGTGVVAVTMATAMANTTYSVVTSTAENIDAVPRPVLAVATTTVFSVITRRTDTGAAIDLDFTCLAIGNQ